MNVLKLKLGLSAMGWWKLLMFLVTVLVGFARGLDLDEYDDGASIDPIEPYNDTDHNTSDTAARLNCSKLVLLHKAVKTQENATGSIYKPQPPIYPVLPLPFYSGYDIQENHTENQNNKPTKNTTELKWKWRISTTPVTVTANYSISDNNSYWKEENDTRECTPGFDDDGSQYNWYQIILQNGGPPGEVNTTRLVPNVTEVLEPCRRPIITTSPPLQDLLYEYELIEFEKIYRHEKAFLRFAGSLSEFVDIVGQLVWAPPYHERQYYHVSYRKDDTGFYVNVRQRHKCIFEKNPLIVRCHQVKDFVPCEGNIHGFSFAPGLTASLIG